MIIVSGRTFPNRELLQRLGGRWERDIGYKFRSLSDADIEQIRNIPGLMISGGNAAPVKHAIYGDDRTYYNHFAHRDPRAFFGFSSLDKLTNYIDTRGPDCRVRLGWGKEMKEALKIARGGWQEGVTMAETIRDSLLLANPPQRQRKPSVAGGVVNVGRLLSGNPLHMTHRAKLPGSRVVTLFVEAGCPGYISPETLVMRAAVIAAIIDMMENNGYSCNIVAVDTSLWFGRVEYQLAVTLKLAGERLNIADIAFGLGHPAFLRCFSFACQTSVEECRESWAEIGKPANAFDKSHPCGPNEYYVGVVHDDKPDIDSLIPPGLPLEFKLS